MALLAFIQPKRHFVANVLALSFLFPVLVFIVSQDQLDKDSFLATLHIPQSLSDFVILGCFYIAGSLLAIIRHRSICRNLLLASTVGVLVLPTLGTSFGIVGLLVAIPLLVVAIGESNLQQRLGLVLSNDMSYGIYIYAFPVQQIVSMMFPGITWQLAFIVALAATIILARYSWRYIESPCLAFKKNLKPRQ
jgi:peptidoglycan/LPS O-acetylase OafA/YrhL